jgi:hypothetical protein
MLIVNIYKPEGISLPHYKNISEQNSLNEDIMIIVAGDLIYIIHYGIRMNIHDMTKADTLVEMLELDLLIPTGIITFPSSNASKDIAIDLVGGNDDCNGLVRRLYQLR